MPITIVSQKRTALFSYAAKSERVVESAVRLDSSLQKVTTEKPPHHPLVHKVKVVFENGVPDNNNSGK